MLEQEEGVIEGDDNLKKYITNYYKKLFDKAKRKNIFLEKTEISDIPWVSDEQNSVLLEEFTGKEVKEAIFQMKHSKPPGLMGFQEIFIRFFGVWSKKI